MGESSPVTARCKPLCGRAHFLLCSVLFLGWAALAAYVAHRLALVIGNAVAPESARITAANPLGPDQKLEFRLGAYYIAPLALLWLGLMHLWFVMAGRLGLLWRSAGEEGQPHRVPDQGDSDRKP